MAVHMLGASVAACGPFLRLSTGVAGRRQAMSGAVLCEALPIKLRHTSSFGLQASHGFSMRAAETRRLPSWSLQAGSADQQDTVSAAEQKVSEVKKSVAETEEAGPPFLTIIAAIFVAVLVFWGIWSLLSAIAGFFFH